jgi:hypothetical protein
VALAVASIVSAAVACRKLEVQGLQQWVHLCCLLLLVLVLVLVLLLLRMLRMLQVGASTNIAQVGERVSLTNACFTLHECISFCYQGD